MEQQLNWGNQDLEKPSELEMERNELRCDLAKIQKGKQKVKNGKRIQKLQIKLEELNKKIKVESLSLDKESIKPPDTGVSKERCQQISKIEIQLEENSLKGTKALCNSPSDTDSDVDSGKFSLRGEIISTSLCEGHQEEMAKLMNSLGNKDKLIKSNESIIETQKKQLESQKKQLESQKKHLEYQNKQFESQNKQFESQNKELESLKEQIGSHGKQVSEHYDLLLHRTKFINKLENTLQSYKEEIQGYEQQLEAKNLLIKNLQQSDCSSKELLSEREKFEELKLDNNKLLEKLKSYQDVIASLESKGVEMENQLKDKQENIFLLQHEKENVLGKWKIDLQDQTGLSEKLSGKEKEIRSLTEDLAKEKDKSKNLNADLPKMTQDLTNTQKLLRQFHIKIVNWGNFYSDLEKDYYNGLNFHLDKIYWLEDQCGKLKSSNQYFE